MHHIANLLLLLAFANPAARASLDAVDTPRRLALNQAARAAGMAEGILILVTFTGPIAAV
jgi:hypothetical protein